jgi:hypothetical protein
MERSLACWPFPEKLTHGCNPGSFQVGSWVPWNQNERRCSEF